MLSPSTSLTRRSTSTSVRYHQPQHYRHGLLPSYLRRARRPHHRRCHGAKTPPTLLVSTWPRQLRIAPSSATIASCLFTAQQISPSRPYPSRLRPVTVDPSSEYTSHPADSDIDSDTLVPSTSTSTASLTSSVLRFRSLHGRTCQNYDGADYWQPNDTTQNDGLDLVTALVGEQEVG